jgi:ankyrin repeat protein
VATRFSQLKNEVVATVRLLLSHRSISPNGIHPPGTGITALHLASSLGRADVVNLLLEQEGIDDSLRDRLGKTCRDLARGKEVTRTIDGTCSCHTISLKF